jgi:hypothetical protein
MFPPFAVWIYAPCYFQQRASVPIWLFNFIERIDRFWYQLDRWPMRLTSLSCSWPPPILGDLQMIGKTSPISVMKVQDK